MELQVLNPSFKIEGVIDTFTSLVWADRYSKAGDFELTIPISSEALGVMAIDNYLTHPESNHVMVIETWSRGMDANVQDGNTITFTGRSVESFLDRRVIWPTAFLSGNIQTAIQTMLNDYVISPTDTGRKIDEVIFALASGTFPTLTDEMQFTGDNLYDVIVDICEVFGIGFKMPLTIANKFQFQLYNGVDRSYSQTTNPYVVFSPDFDNLASSNHLYSTALHKTMAFVAGEGEGTYRRWNATAIPSGYGSGRTRREMFVDARDLQSSVDDIVLTPAEYMGVLAYRGREQLVKHPLVNVFDGEALPTELYTYGVDYAIGDVVQIVTDYGFTARARITEYIWTQSEQEITAYPTFSEAI
jgi:hypothetical protein